MSFSAYNDALKGLGTAFKLKKKAYVAGSGSNPPPEEGSQNNAVSRPDFGEEDWGPKKDAKVEAGDEFENLEEIEPLGDVPEVDVIRRRKRLRSVGTKPPRSEKAQVVSGSESGRDKGKGLEEERPARSGPGLDERVARFMAEIPSQAEWKDMNASGFDATMKECTRLWGQLGGYMAGAAAMSYSDLKHARATIANKDAELAELKDQISVKDTSLSGLNNHLNDVTVRVENAEKEVADLKSELAELRMQISAARPESEVIEDFKKSAEYDRALANAGAPEI
ncbi:uncharacterized protein LOC141716610 [Apium graveolens]|uniref:uncharacterized protein LOC141716610 n=1 Tax=Apium graveolens TaxID=4045 RepID=UPI003D79B760